jgi:hypothetical protein
MGVYCCVRRDTGRNKTKINYVSRRRYSRVFYYHGGNLSYRIKTINENGLESKSVFFVKNAAKATAKDY